MSSDPIRVLYVSHLHPPDGKPLKNLGGMQRVSMQLTRELKKREDVELIPIILKAPWKGIALRTAGFLVRLAVRLPNLAKKENADLIFFSSMVTASVSMLVRRRIDIPLITIAHGQDVTLPSTLYQKLVPRVFQQLDGVIAVSSATRKACINRGMNPENIEALGNGFDEKDRNKYPGRSEGIRQVEEHFEYQKSDGYLLLTVGRLIKRKGHERFIRHILPEIGTSVHYLIIGDGPQREAIEPAVRDSGMQSRVTIAGRQPDSMLRAAYVAADLFIMPNVPVEGDMEGFGIVLLEANLAGTAAVASDLEGIRDVIENGENGYRIESGNNSAFADKIEELLQKDAYQSLGERAREYVLERFSWRKVAGRYLRFIRKIVRRQ